MVLRPRDRQLSVDPVVRMTGSIVKGSSLISKIEPFGQTATGSSSSVTVTFLKQKSRFQEGSLTKTSRPIGGLSLRSSQTNVLDLLNSTTGPQLSVGREEKI